jgi:hypothetical protein
MKDAKDSLPIAASASASRRGVAFAGFEIRKTQARSTNLHGKLPRAKLWSCLFDSSYS